MISTFGNTKTLKSVYISIFGFNILGNTSQTLTGLTFQSISKGAHLFVRHYPIKQADFSQYSQRRSLMCAWASLEENRVKVTRFPLLRLQRLFSQFVPVLGLFCFFGGESLLNISFIISVSIDLLYNTYMCSHIKVVTTPICN